MKLWYQSLARQAQTIYYGVDLKKIIDSVVEPGTTVHLQGLARQQHNLGTRRQG